LISGQILPWALAFSAGAMLFIVSDEIIPETHRPGYENGATFSLFIGFGLMMFLDAALA
jgi:zinc transporter, ZIP family